MKVTSFKVPGPLLVEPDIFEDARGYFFQSYSEPHFAKHGIHEKFVQDNQSRSYPKGVLRGLHFQVPPRAQAKLVRVIRGKVFDVALDIRKGSSTFGKHVSAVLSAENKQILYLPAGFAHAFLTLEENTEFLYKVSDVYSPAHEGGILWSDSALDIAWPKLDVSYTLSERDQKYPPLSQVRF